VTGLTADLPLRPPNHAQEFAAAMPTSRAPRATAISTAHVERYAALCEELFRKSLMLHAPGGSATGSVGGAADAARARARARWRRAIERTRDINAARRGGASALSRLVGGMLSQGDVEAIRWCATLLLLQQLGLGLWRLQDCLSELLAFQDCGRRVALDERRRGPVAAQSAVCGGL
jgi:hypothetical protein